MKALLGQQKAYNVLLDLSELSTTLTTSQREDMKLNVYGTLL